MQVKGTPRDEARRLALSHFLLSFLLYLGLAFLAPRNLLQYDFWLPSGPPMAINTAIGILAPLRAWAVFVPLLLALAYVDYRVYIWLASSGGELRVTLWSLVVPAGIGATGLWFAWALTQWSVEIWHRHSPAADASVLAPLPYVVAAALGALGACAAVDAGLRRRRKTGRSKEGKHQRAADADSPQRWSEAPTSEAMGDE